MTAVVNINEVSDEESDDAFLSAEENHSESEDSSHQIETLDNDDTDSGSESSVKEDGTDSDGEPSVKEVGTDSDGELSVKEGDSSGGSGVEENDDTTSDQSVNEADNSDSKDEASGDDDVNTGWADAMSKILKTNKPKKKKTLVLSRAKKLANVKKVVKKGDPGFEVVGDDKEDKPTLDQLIKTEVDDDGEPKSKKRREELPNLRVKPNILEKGREKILSKIATRGVVQLFNAVRKQQKDIESKIEKVGPLERKKEKVIKSLDKHKFLDMLMGQTKSEVVNKELMKKEVKEEESTWSVFRNDFMSGAKMKDWDKKEKATEDDDKMSELSDSDSD